MLILMQTRAYFSIEGVLEGLIGDYISPPGEPDPLFGLL